MAQASRIEVIVMFVITTFICWWLGQNLNGGAYLAIAWVTILVVWCWVKESAEPNSTLH